MAFLARNLLAIARQPRIVSRLTGKLLFSVKYFPNTTASTCVFY